MSKPGYSPLPSPLNNSTLESLPNGSAPSFGRCDSPGGGSPKTAARHPDLHPVLSAAPSPPTKNTIHVGTKSNFPGRCPETSPAHVTDNHNMQSDSCIGYEFNGLSPPQCKYFNAIPNRKPQSSKEQPCTELGMNERPACGDPYSTACHFLIANSNQDVEGADV